MKTACKRSIAVGIILGLALLIGASYLYAQIGPWSGHGFGNYEERAAIISLYLTKKLDLDASQQQELETITHALLQKGKALRDARINARQQMVSILRANSVDAQHIQLLQNESRQALNDFVTEAGSRLTEFVNMLSPEQRQSLAKLIQDHSGCCVAN